MILEGKDLENGNHIIRKDDEDWFEVECNEETTRKIIDVIVKQDEEYQKQINELKIEMQALAKTNEFLSELIGGIVTDKLDDIDHLIMSKRLLSELADTLEILAKKVGDTTKATDYFKEYFRDDSET